MAEYSIEHAGTVNSEALDQALKTENPAVTGISTSPGIVRVFTDTDLTQTEIDALVAIVAAHNPATLSKQQEVDQARVGLSEVRRYLLLQLVKAVPDTPAQQVTAIKLIANGNTYLVNVMTNQINEMNDVFGWSLTLNPNNLATRRQFVFTVKILTGVLPQG